MIRLLLSLAAIAAIGAGAAWMAGHPGNVTIYWFDWRIDTSFAFLLLVALVIALVVGYIFVLLRALVQAPTHFSERRQIRHYRKGMTELTYSVAALAAADHKSAQLHTRKAEKLLGQTPLTLLLSAQLARSEGDDVKTRLLLTKMLDHKETEYLAARSLADAASKERMFSKALPLAERATSVNPREKTSAAAVIGLHLRLSAWQEAIAAADKAMRKGALLRSERRYFRGITCVKQGMTLLEENQTDAALAAARMGLKYVPSFAPAVIFAARAFAAAGKPDKAVSLVLKHWKHAPHPELATALRIATAKDSPEKQMKAVRKLVAILPTHAESHLAVAETAIKLKEWDLARKSLKIVLEKEESMRACKLMAYVEQGEFSDFDAAGRWLARSAEALTDPAWVCDQCAHTADHWDTHCSACSAFDALRWRQPKPLLFSEAAA